MNRYILKVAGYTLVLFVALSGCKPEKLDLKLNLEEGKTYTYTISTEENTEQGMSGQQRKMEQSTLFSYSMNVKNVDTANNQTVDVKYDRIKVNQKSDQLSLSFDSKEAASKDTGYSVMMAKQFRPLIGNGFTMIFQPDGTVSSVKSSETLINAILANMSEGMSPDTVSMMRPQVEMQMNEFVKANMEPGFGFYPGKLISKGDTWTVPETMQGGIPVVINSTYKLDKISGKTAYLSVDSKITVDSTNQMAAQLKVEGKGSGKLEVDTQTGLISKGQYQQDINMSMESMGMQLKINAKTTIEGKKK